MKKALLVLALLATTAHAQMEKGPRDYYSVEKMMTYNFQVKVIPVDDVNASCEKESRKRGFGGFGGTRMEACSFWSPTQCTIVVGKRTNNDILGHELHHCLAGSFH